MPSALREAEQREALQLQRIEELERQLQTETEQRAAAEADLAARRSPSTEPSEASLSPAELLARHVLLALGQWAPAALDDSIPRPKGTIINLQKHMGIPQEKKKYYNAIRKMFGKKMETAGIVWYKYLNKQEHKNVQNFIIKMRHEIPYMRRFAGDWASAEIVRTILKNDRDEHHKQNLEEDVALHATAFRQRPKRTTLPASTPNSPQSQRRLSSHDGQRSRSSTPLSQPRDGSPQTHHTPPPAPSGGSKRPRTLATDANAAGGDGDGDGDDNDDEEEEEEAPRPKRVCRNRNAAGPSNAGTARGTVTPAGNKKTNTATRPRRKSADASRAGNSSTSRR